MSKFQSLLALADHPDFSAKPKEDRPKSDLHIQAALGALTARAKREGWKITGADVVFALKVAAGRERAAASHFGAIAAYRLKTNLGGPDVP